MNCNSYVYSFTHILDNTTSEAISEVFLIGKKERDMLEENYMRLAISLAEQTKQQTSPNPPVGAVVVNHGDVVGFGAHLQAGDRHAEVLALDMAKEKAKGATLFVTLEPCSHYGKTPPCVNYIIDHDIARVVIACKDENDLVGGKGIEKLKRAGIEVEVGLLEEEAKLLYDSFFHYVKTKRPYVTLKTAMSLDGKIATNTLESKWITNETARRDAQQYRHVYDAILVGVNTVIHDNPQLTTRIQHGKNPIRIIFDTHLRTPLDAHVVTDEKVATWIITGSEVTEEQMAPFLEKKFVRILKMSTKTLYVEDVLKKLGEEQITSLYVEGGATVNGSFLTAQMINQLVVYVAPIVIGGKDAPSPFLGSGFSRLQEALRLQIKETSLIDGQLKIVAKKGEE